MNTAESFHTEIFKINNENFNDFALELFHFQSENNKTYKTYLEKLGVSPANVATLQEIPFLPISFFKHFDIKTGDWQERLVFESSGTTGQETSRHFVRSPDFYQQVSHSIFKELYGDLEDYVVLALLPSYLERGNSSLVYMVDYFIRKSNNADSGFYLHNQKDLAEKLKALKENNAKVVLFGVTFALLDFAEQYPFDFPNLTIIETGGMKGRKKEMTRMEVHEIIKSAFSVKKVHSEYGMTELLSQAYSMSDGKFSLPTWAKVKIRDVNDPFSYTDHNRSGGINIIDLANIDSCAFIETKDLGRLDESGQFEVLGRFDNTEIRGCNLLVI